MVSNSTLGNQLTEALVRLGCADCLSSLWRSERLRTTAFRSRVVPPEDGICTRHPLRRYGRPPANTSTIRIRKLRVQLDRSLRVALVNGTLYSRCTVECLTRDRGANERSPGPRDLCGRQWLRRAPTHSDCTAHGACWQGYTEIRLPESTAPG